MLVQVVDVALKEDFGYKNILWIFSGRRGVHCWVCDPDARALPNEARDAVVHYLGVDFAGAENADDERKMRPFTGKMHASLERAYAILEPMFEKYIVSKSGQGLLATKRAYMPVLNSLPDSGIRKELHDAWEKRPHLSAAERWEMMKEATEEGSGGAKRAKLAPKAKSKLEAWRRELVLRHTYPRLDANVSKQQNHLLKSPFCVHPKTGRVCVPIDPDQAEKFNPFTVPTIRQLDEELNDWSLDAENKNRDGKSETTDLEKTSMRGPIAYFENTFLEGLKANARKEARDREDRKSAMEVDF